MSNELKLICVDLPAPPLFDKAAPDGTRVGYEPSAAELVADVLGKTVRWVVTSWSDMVPAVQDGRGDAIWCGQGITPSRAELVDFTRPYAIFDESVLVLADSGINAADDLRGKRVGAIVGSTNLALAETFDGVTTVPFDGATDDVLGDMVQALRDGEIDAVVDDDVAIVPLGEQSDLAVAFTVATRNRWGVSVAKGNDTLRISMDAALNKVIADGSLEAEWKRWMPDLPFPLTADE
ncbi:amino acid ABC transporter substrate-binding protein (PAAT family) [Rhodococcus wratislaviensis]|uniref:Glutamate-binding protein n=3 Tax=Rhodococcus TaxID=1827 RepID=A0AB38FD63_RHOWR|nr:MULTISPECIES: ABC transporter substrate-binding protein [Rhodococcus]AII07613.1 glutamine-binding protein [Rhodococcus opacus]REE75385.1 amino acid ABC transporter substrate-binding protein (PAAT family) [Rhodococcus wratislaviensis]WAM11741.1 ABC transporter substrate-binding protein [Rhodococcus sp. JS3073]SPZ39582.1 glutamate-binding protein [Rhodococcus wratislaviensis]GAF44466.1 putative ABC transporter substrate-binding protein [Rhodococcus wratislaviensis NBRC 100605]